jgi:altronate hydrolase
MKAIKLYPNDTVALAVVELRKGDSVKIDKDTIRILDDIPNAHKFALKDFTEGEVVIKYDNPIGYASKPIRKGEWIHEHNLVTGLGKTKEYTYDFSSESTIFPGGSDDTFMGYLRSDGTAGIRNYLAVIPTVSCANGPLQQLVKLAEKKYAEAENFDGIVALTHPYGCSQTGKDFEITAKILAGVIQNANFGGVLLVSLGCEITHPDTLEPFLEGFDKSRIRILSLQDCEDEFAAGLSMIDELMTEILVCKRRMLSFSKLHIAMNCGGSDGYSGITANTLLGTLCDTMVSKGATMSMTEVPEMMGAEHILMNRAVNEKVFGDLVRLIQDYEAYFAKYGEKAADNPTQGNKAGGLTTLEEKSLGCTQKGGHCAVSDVLAYGDRAKTRGFILISGPGNDLVCITGQIAAGAVLVVFTTGRGTPCGFAAPVFRLSSNTALAAKKPNWIDYDAGRLLAAAEDPCQIESLNKELYDKILDTVNGKYATCTERNAYFQMGILRDGVTL